MGHPKDWKLLRLKIDEDLIEQIDNIAKTRDEQKADVLADTIDNLVKSRADGTASKRYFASPESATYKSIWVKPETYKTICMLADTDDQNLSRVIYTAIVRFIENPKDKNPTSK
ncbi:hypothetical protein [Enterobacter hormaechei]|uniref:hypothetical protein n=1 Tax=Enterobacter hormaechei TaxID=158836 RepID=UPI001259375D|nr:hypothetical protein [Enterobacter hormaechei]EDK1561886.1 hypothetical protein [Salmonella enterica subsp. enterica serovar Newport]EIY8279333.1 hypothetical protein [Salmonella enterica]EKK9105914.1 hypothetical protein [Salmonella enterica]VAK79307.1 Uncharacterised protein [Enterobacter cloacae]